MSTIQLLADSTTLVLNGRLFNDFIDGDALVLSSPNELASRNRSTRGINIQKRSDSNVKDLTFTVPKYSDDDIYMNSQINKDIPVIFKGSVKENYIKDGLEFVTTYTLEDGTITTQPTDTRNNVDGNQDMSYTIQFNKAIRA
tara:strand:+ start:13758 stop:14183 length:426 start_codon:yes stop_codon:yes gene_type:complete